jgi:carbamoylphosphate synthase small subunit
MALPGKNLYAVQFHPEAAGGPCDTQWIFDDFVKSIELNKN